MHSFKCISSEPLSKMLDDLKLREVTAVLSFLNLHLEKRISLRTTVESQNIHFWRLFDGYVHGGGHGRGGPG